MPSEGGDEAAPQDEPSETEKVEGGVKHEAGRAKDALTGHDDENSKQANTPPIAGQTHDDPKIRQPAKADEPFTKWEREEMEELLGELRGHLGEY